MLRTKRAGTSRVPRSFIALLPALLTAPLARAQSTAAPRLTWQAPPGCPDATAASQRLETALGSELWEYGRGWQVQARVTPSGASAWQLLLELREPGRAPSASPLQRVLRASRCEDLVEAAAVAVAIAIGDARDAAQASATTEASAVAPVTHDFSVSAPTAPPADVPELDAAQGSTDLAPPLRRSLDLSLEALLDSASVSAAALGGSLGAGAWFGSLGVDLHATWLPSQQQRIAPGQSADFGLLAGGLRGCYRAWGNASGFGVAPCLGFELGRFSADSHGLLQSASARDLWAAPSLGVDLRGSLLGPLAVRSRLELLLPLRRQEYRVDLVQQVHEIPALTVRWSLGVDADLGLP